MTSQVLSQSSWAEVAGGKISGCRADTTDTFNLPNPDLNENGPGPSSPSRQDPRTPAPAISQRRRREPGERYCII